MSDTTDHDGEPEPLTEAEIREFLSRVAPESADAIAHAWINDRITASAWVMMGNSIIE